MAGMTAGSIRNVGVYYICKHQFIHNYSPAPFKIRNLKNESRTTSEQQKKDSHYTDTAYAKNKGEPVDALP